MNKAWNLLEKCMYTVLIKWLRIKPLEKSWDAFLQFVKFGIVGVSNTLIQYFSYLILLWLGMYYIFANVIGFLISVTNSYYWNNKYVFKTKENEQRSGLRTYLKTLTAYAFTGLFLENVFLVVWVEMLHVSKTIAPIITLLITIPLNFIMNKFWAYRGHKNEENEDKAVS